MSKYEPASPTESAYRHHRDDHVGHWWDDYDDGDEDEDAAGDNGGERKWRHDGHDNDDSPWRHHGHDGVASPHGQKHTPRRDDDKNGHGHHGVDRGDEARGGRGFGGNTPRHSGERPGRSEDDDKNGRGEDRYHGDEGDGKYGRHTDDDDRDHHAQDEGDNGRNDGKYRHAEHGEDDEPGTDRNDGDGYDPDEDVPNDGGDKRDQGGKDEDHNSHDKAIHVGDEDEPSGDDSSSLKNGGGDEGEQPRDTDDGPVPVKTIRVAQQLRQDTEAFVSDTLEWVNEMVGEDLASTLMIDTTFSLTKNEVVDLERGPCGNAALARVFPLLHKFIDSPQDVGLLDDDVAQTAWTPSSACINTRQDAFTEIEGGIYASFQVTCSESAVINVSFASSGSTPTIQGKRVEDKSFYVSVDVLDGRIRATDAQGSISGILESRHFPENAGEVQKNWTAALKRCAADKTLVLTGVVGGGWTACTPLALGGNDSEAYEVAAVGYTESFGFSFATADALPAQVVVPTTVPAPASVGDASTGINTVSAPAPAAQDAPTAGSSIAASGASAYVQTGVICSQTTRSSKACAGLAVMSQLTSFYQLGSPAALSLSSQQLVETGPRASMVVPVAAVAGLVLAFVAVAVVTSRRRTGYQRLAVQSPA